MFLVPFVLSLHACLQEITMVRCAQEQGPVL